MRRSIHSTIGNLLFWLLAGATAAQAAAATTCDRACLHDITDGLLASMAGHDPARLPLSKTYLATLNGVPEAPSMMSPWEMTTGLGSRFYVIDPVSEQVLFIATMKEGAGSALLFGRLEVDGRRQLTQIELYVNRSRGDGGFMFDADGPAHLPSVWTERVPAARLPSRSELLQAGRSIFDASIPGPRIAATCEMMENGRLVAENPKVLKWIGVGGRTLHANPDGSLPIPCGSPPDRPSDPQARSNIADTQQGIVVSIATVRGVVEPYLITDPTVSAYVPYAMLKPYVNMLSHQHASGQFTQPALQASPAANTTVEIYRIFDGKLQGMHLLEHMEPAGAISPWVGPRAAKGR